MSRSVRTPGWLDVPHGFGQIAGCCNLQPTHLMIYWSWALMHVQLGLVLFIRLDNQYMHCSSRWLVNPNIFTCLSLLCCVLIYKLCIIALRHKLLLHVADQIVQLCSCNHHSYKKHLLIGCQHRQLNRVVNAVRVCDDTSVTGFELVLPPTMTSNRCLLAPFDIIVAVSSASTARSALPMHSVHCVYIFYWCWGQFTQH